MEPQIKDFDTKLVKKESFSHILDSEEFEDDLDCKIAAQLSREGMELIDLAHFRLSDLLQDIYPDENFPQPASSQDQSSSDIEMQWRADSKR